MGRPVHKKFFGNTNIGGNRTGVGGEGIATIVINSAGSGYSTTTSVTWLAGVPGISAGTRASGTVAVNASGVPTAFAVTTQGSGYLSTATTVTITPNPVTTGTFTLNLTTGRQNALSFLAWAPTASNGTVNSGGSAVGGDIVKQQGTKRYYVKTAQGYGVCSLVATTPEIGQMTLEATDANSNTYYVTRLESKKARLTRKTQSGSNAWVYATNDLAKWTLTAANGTNKALVTTTVQIANV